MNARKPQRPSTLDRESTAAEHSVRHSKHKGFTYRHMLFVQDKINHPTSIAWAQIPAETVRSYGRVWEVLMNHQDADGNYYLRDFFNDSDHVQFSNRDAALMAAQEIFLPLALKFCCLQHIIRNLI